MTEIRRKPKQKPKPTHYMVLRVPPCSLVEEIHDAFLELAFKTHPDRGGNLEEFQAINLAWGILKNKESRELYDSKLKIEGNLCGHCNGRGRKWKFPNGEQLCVICLGTGQKGV